MGTVVELGVKIGPTKVQSDVITWFSMKLHAYTIFGMLSPKIIVGRTVSKGVGHHLATVPENEKIQLPTTNSNEPQYVYCIWFAEWEGHSP